MKIQIPEHVRLCGMKQEIGTEKEQEVIYIEDYVTTFFRQVMERYPQEEVVLNLYGRRCDMAGDAEKGHCYMISAAGFPEEQEDFSELTCLGQTHFCVHKKPEEYIAKVQKDRNSVHVVRQPEDGSLVFFLNEDGYVRRIERYYVFYEQNEKMQNYLIAWYRKTLQQNQTKPLEGEDRAAKDFRRRYEERQNERQQTRMMGVLYGLSLLLTILCVVTGISAMNQYDKMKQMGQSVEHLIRAMEEREKEGQELADAVEAMSQSVQRDSLEGENTTLGEREENAVVAVQETGENSQMQNGEELQTIEMDVPYYIVREGDTLAQISRDIYGTSSKLAEICEKNNIDNPNNIMVGQKILLP